MTKNFMTTKELSAYLNLNEKKIYALVKRRAIPFTKVTGKYIFPRDSINRWIEDSIIDNTTGRNKGKITITGSHDPAIDLLVSEVNRLYNDVTMLMGSVGSTKGLELLREGSTDMAGIHILDPETNNYNLPWLEKHTPGLKPVVVHFALRSQGLIVAKGNPMGISGIKDLNKKGLKFINRQKGSGTRLLFEHLAAKAGLDTNDIDLSEGDVATHTEVAQAVRTGRTHTGIGVKSAAIAAGLDFIHLTEESFDIAVSRRNFYSEPTQKCLEVVRSSDFRKEVSDMGGYNTADSGSVISWG
ncbi:MAG TPA: substrate-binding domain-containing protein [Candidatus Krumholzibacteriaceae bacterium]|nr:substrate-binding domain-containing protein [Candidatus Krumholzibacteriaceae bacterium]